MGELYFRPNLIPVSLSSQKDDNAHGVRPRVTRTPMEAAAQKTWRNLPVGVGDGEVPTDGIAGCFHAYLLRHAAPAPSTVDGVAAAEIRYLARGDSSVVASR